MLAGASVLLIAAAGFCWTRWWRMGKSPIEPVPGYVGDLSCRACHRTIYDSYKRTAMGRSWYVPATENVIEDYSPNNQAYDPKRDLHYEMIARDSRFFQREYRIDEHGAVIHELVRQISYIVGSGEHVRSYVTDAGGYLNQMPVSWFTEEKKWDLSPGYKEFNHRFDRQIGPTCVACHNDYPHHVAGTHHRYEPPIPTGIGCERCHGPAEWHVREQREGWEPSGRHASMPTIVNPARLPADRRNDVCFQCHIQGDAEFINPGQDQFGFRPGLRLADFRSVYLAEASDPAKFGIASHAVRMAQSRCYIESKGRLSCVTCHDPHIPLREVRAESYRESCLSCHTFDSCHRVADSSVAHQKNDCVTCHMARGQPADVQHTVFTDHWIRRPVSGETRERQFNRPATLSDQAAQEGSATASQGQAAQQSSELVRLHSFWDEPRADDEREGIAHVTFAFAHGSRFNLDHGIELLQKAGARGTLHRDGWQKLGRAALARENPSLAASALQRALQADPNDGMSCMGLGLALRALGYTQRALAQLERAIELAPDQLEAYSAAASIYVEQRQFERAVALLEESLRRNPYLGATWATLGSVYGLQSGQAARSIDAFRRAIQLDPDNPGLRLALGSVYLANNELNMAREQIQQGLRAAPEHVPALLAMARLHSLMQEKPQAIQCVRQALRLQPQNQYARNLLLELGERLDSNAAGSKDGAR